MTAVCRKHDMAWSLLEDVENVLKGALKGSNLLNVWGRLCQGRKEKDCLISDDFM